MALTLKRRSGFLSSIQKLFDRFIDFVCELGDCLISSINGCLVSCKSIAKKHLK